MNKPVAWMDEQGKVFSNPLSAMRNQAQGNVIPLYTHPVKELTDEEIDQVTDECCLSYYDPSAYRAYARAILRKAQEK